MSMSEQRTAARRGIVSFGWHIWVPVVLVVVILVVSAFSTSRFFPPLSEVVSDTWQVWIVHRGWYDDLLPSLVRLLVGLAIALVVGVALGTLFGLLPRLEVAFRPLTEAFRAVPGAALLPIAMSFFGTGGAMKLSLIAFASMWPIMLNTTEGVRALDPTLRKVMATFHIRARDRFFSVYLPSIAPQVFAGLRVALAIGVAVMVVVEMFGTPGGIGYYIRDAQQNFQTVGMWTGIIVLGIFGYVLNVLFRAAERRVLGWHHRMVAHMQGGAQ